MPLAKREGRHIKGRKGRKLKKGEMERERNVKKWRKGRRENKIIFHMERENSKMKN